MWRESVRWNPGRTGLASMLAVAALTLLVAGWWLVRSQPHRLAPVVPRFPASLATTAPGGSLASPVATTTAHASPSGQMVVVDVVGKVRKPGVYRLEQGAGVIVAIGAAGGAAPGQDLTLINLARTLIDGEQIAVGVPGAGGGSGGSRGETGGPGGAGAVGGLVDLNTATLADLDTLPGVGPVLAQHILHWRTEHGRFDSVDQLQSVSGVGDSKFASLKPLVTVR